MLWAPHSCNDRSYSYFTRNIYNRDSLNQCGVKANLAFDMSVDIDVEQGKISIVPENLKTFHFS